MGGHENEGIEMEAQFGFVFLEEFQVEAKFVLFREDDLPLVPPGNDMIKSPDKMNPRSASHGRILRLPLTLVNS